ncbi:interleukin-31 [Thomomys bottae]
MGVPSEFSVFSGEKLSNGFAVGGTCVTLFLPWIRYRCLLATMAFASGSRGHWRGSTKPALALLCYVATWLSMLANPIGGPSLCDTKMILENLQFGVGTLAEHYELDEKTGLPQHPAGRPALPCFTPGPQAANNISVLRAYVKKVKELIQPANQTAMEAILKQLQDLQYEDTPEPHVSEPLHENFAKKMFIKAVFQEFSTCVNTSYSAFKARLKEEGRHCVHK